MIRPIGDDDIGLKVLREAPDGAKDVIDIIAIHGIGAHPDDTWCKTIGLAESSRQVNWLSDEKLLPAVVPHARVLRYGYRSKWFGQGLIRQNASTVAPRLLAAINRKRQECPWRPLVFIAHCFGGLVVLKALIEAKHDEKIWPGTFVSTVGLIFLSTPFRGAEGMDLQELYEAARTEYREDQVQIAIFRILGPGDEFREELLDQFAKIRTLMNKAKVACFYELEFTDVGKIVGQTSRMRFAVSKSSGCLDLSEDVSKHSFSRTHFEMNKFGSHKEEDFEILSEVMRKMACGAYQAVKAQYKERYGTQMPGNQTGIPIQKLAASTALPTSSKKALSVSTGKKKKGHPMPPRVWSSEENQMLLAVVHSMPVVKWRDVAQCFMDRSDYACEKHFEALMAKRQ